MWHNYLKVAFRYLARRKSYTAVNVVGMAVGIACCALISLYLKHEWSYDRFHDQSERIYRVVKHQRDQLYSVVGFKQWWRTPSDMQQVFPQALESSAEVEAVTHFYLSPNKVSLRAEGKRLPASDLLLTNRGAALTEIFSFDFLVGDAATALAKPYSVVLTSSEAKRFYGDEPALGKTLFYQDTIACQVTGVIEDIPSNSHFEFNMAVSVNWIPNWGATTYFLTKQGVDVSQERLDQLTTEALYVAHPDLQNAPQAKGCHAQRLADIHFEAGRGLYDFKPAADAQTLYIFMAIGLAILLICTTNYMNLSLAMYAGRHKEIGIRKMAGARRGHVAAQFLIEAVLLVSVSLPVAYCLLELSLPVFNRLMGVRMSNGFLNGSSDGLWLLLAVVFTGLVAGAYPALVLSAQRITALFHKGKDRSWRSGIRMREGLVTAQFTLLIVLTSIAYLMNQQLHYVNNKDLGHDRSGILTMPIRDVQRFAVLKERLLSHPEIEAVVNGMALAREPFNHTTYKVEGQDGTFTDMHTLYFGRDFFKVYGIPEPEAVRALDRSDGPQSVVLVNKAFCRARQIEDPTGRTLVEDPESFDEESQTYGRPSQIDGICADFNLFSLREAVGPMMIEIFRQPDWINGMNVRFNAQQTKASVQIIEKEWDAILPDTPLDFTFLSDDLDRFYRQEKRSASLSLALSGIAVFLSLIGLIGLSAYMTESRRKEIGIRRILGASAGQLLVLINKSYIRLVVLATVVAAPIGWRLTHLWLTDFAYRIEVGWQVFMGAGLGTLAVALATVSWQSMRAVRANPADALRDE